MRRLALLLIVLGTGCPGASRSRVVETPETDPMANLAGGLVELKRDLEATVLENFSHLSLGNLDAYTDSISTERHLALVGVRSKDIVSGVAPYRRRRDRRLYRNRDINLYSKNLEIHVSKDGATGWVSDEISYRVPYSGREAALPIRYTGVFVRGADRWELVAEHMAYPLPKEEIVSFARSGQLPALRRMAASKPKDGGEKQVSELLRRLYRGEAAFRRLVVANDEESLILLPDPGDEYRGAKTVNAPPLRQLIGKGQIQVGSMVVGVSPTGSAAWATAQLTLKTVASDDRVKIPLRASYVLTRDGKDSWKIVQTHISVPIAEKRLNERVFGVTKLEDEPRRPLKDVLRQAASEREANERIKNAKPPAE